MVQQDRPPVRLHEDGPADDDPLGPLPAGTVVAKYEIIDTLGQGGFGITYRARDVQLRRDVAIKEYLPASFAKRRGGTTVLPRSTHTAEDFLWGRERFLDEARTLATLEDAPGIVNVYDFMEANGTAYMVMGLVRGETVEARLKRDRRLPQPAIEQMIYPLLDGLELVHQAGFLHRDIKPSNILLDVNGRPTLIDFGASRVALMGRTQTLTAVYTPGYAAFEQSTSARQGPWTDIYALSATLYHCITGGQPLAATDRMIDDGLVPAVEAGRGRYAPSLLAAIDAGLKLKAAERPQTIADMRRVLSGVGGRGADELPGTPTRPMDEAVTRPMGTARERKPRPSWLWLAAGVVALAVAGGGGWMAMRSGPEPKSDTAQRTDAEARQRAAAQRETEEQRATAEARRKAEEDSARKAVEEKAAAQRQTEEAERQRAAEEAKRRGDAAAEAERKATAEAEARRLAAEAERRRASEDATRKAEADAARQAAAEKAAVERRAAEVEAARKAEEEAARKVAEEKAVAEAAARRRAEDEARVEAQRRQEEEARREAEARARTEAEARRRAEEEARTRLEAEAATRRRDEELRREAEEKVRAEIAAREKSEADARRKAEDDVRRKAEDEARREAEERAKAETDAKRHAEAGEATLRLSLEDRKRVQVALTALGHSTQGSDGSFGPRTRQMISGWQKSQKAPETGYLTAVQLAALRQLAAPAIARYDEEQKKIEDEKRKQEDEARRKQEEETRKRAEDARRRQEPEKASPPSPKDQVASTQPSAPVPAGAQVWRGAWGCVGSSTPGLDFRIQMAIPVSNGRGSASDSRGGTVTLELNGTQVRLRRVGVNKRGQDVSQTLSGTVSGDKMVLSGGNDRPGVQEQCTGRFIRDP